MSDEPQGIMEPVEKNMGRKITTTERFVYFTLLSGKTAFKEFDNEYPQEVANIVETDGHAEHWVLNDPTGLEQCCVLVGAADRWSGNSGMNIMHVWFANDIEEPFTDLIVKATETWMSRVKRTLKLIEITAKHQSEMLELEVLDIRDIVCGNEFELPAYKFLSQTINTV